MRPNPRLRIPYLLGLGAALLIPCAAAQGTPVLDTFGFWRIHATLRPPLVAEGHRWVPVLTGMGWLDEETDPPPANWPAPDFNDSAWQRAPALAACRTAYLARLCLRGYFEVENPAAAGDLRLFLAFHGGAIVYLNGREIARRHVAAPDLAESYPVEAFLDAQGKPLIGWDKPLEQQTEDDRRRLALRLRLIENLSLPREALRPGTNVLAVEIMRAAYPPEIDPNRLRAGRDPKAPRRWNEMFSLQDFAPHFRTCELTGIRLTAARPEGIGSNAVRRPGLSVWNSDTLAADTDLDWGGQSGEPLWPIRIVGTRNGRFSGKFVMGSTDPLRGVRVTPGDLVRDGGGVIGKENIQVRFGQPWGAERGLHGAGTYTWDQSPDGAKDFPYPRTPTILGALFDSPPEVISVPSWGRVGAGYVPDPRIPPPPDRVPGAVLPVWLTVRVPRDAAPGHYRGRVMAAVEGASPREIPVELAVADWTLPDPSQFTAWVDAVQSPDTLALEYETPLWSDRHWDLMARSFDLLGALGNKVVFVPLLARTNSGNEESLVRWVDRGGGRYDPDFTIMDRYLDLWERRVGPPSIVVLNVWEIYFSDNKQLKPGFDAGELSKETLAAKEAAKERGPCVTVLDPATGRAEQRFLPRMDTPEGRAPWPAMIRGTLERLARRGWGDRVMFGLMSDAWPSKTEVAFYTEAAGRPIPWFSDSHMGVADLAKDMQVLAAGTASRSMREASYPGVTSPLDEMAVLQQVAYSARVWNNVFPCRSETGESQRGWSRSAPIYVMHDRHANLHPMSRWRTLVEMNVVGEQRGIGRLGGDWWPAVRDRHGRRAALVRNRYPEASWRNLDMNIQLLAPGPDGAVATYRYEALRDGLQTAEARIFIERVLNDPKLKLRISPTLLARAEQLLLRRSRLLTKAGSALILAGPETYRADKERAWFMGSNTAGHAWYSSGADWRRMDFALFQMAGEIGRAVR